MHNQPGVTKFSSALPAPPGWLHDVHQQPVCRPTNPPNGASTTTRLSWRCKSLLKVSKRRYLLLPVWGLKVTTSPAPAPRSGPGSPPAAPGFNSGPIAPLTRRVASRAHNLVPARTPPRRGLIFQSTTRFGMTGWVGDPTTGSPGLPSPPVGGPQPLVQQRRPLRRRAHCALENASDQLRRRAPPHIRHCFAYIARPSQRPYSTAKPRQVGPIRVRVL
jgi:hypothetical protein